MNLDEEPFLDEMVFSNHPNEKTQQNKYASPTLLTKTKSFFTKEKARRVLVSKRLAIGNWFIIILSILSIVSTRNRLAAVKRYCPEIPYCELDTNRKKCLLNSFQRPHCLHSNGKTKHRTITGTIPSRGNSRRLKWSELGKS